MRIATAYLARYAASTTRLRQVLARRIGRRLAQAGQPLPDRATLDGLVDPVVERLKRAGLIDDAAFARGRAASLAAKGRPAWRIKADLAHGFGIDAGETGLSDSLDALDETAQATRWAERKRLGPFRLRDRLAKRERDIGALARAGFSVEVARAVVDGEGPQPDSFSAENGLCS